MDWTGQELDTGPALYTARFRSASFLLWTCLENRCSVVEGKIPDPGDGGHRLLVLVVASSLTREGPSPPWCHCLTCGGSDQCRSLC